LAVAGLAAAASTLLIAGMLSAAPAAGAATGKVGLATAAAYSVLGGQTVTNTGPSVLGANVGVSPGTAITGFPPGITHGVKHAADAVALQAQADLTIAYDDAAGRPGGADIHAAVAGATVLSPGVYTASSALNLGGTLTLNGQGDPQAVFIFQIGSALTVDSFTRVLMSGGAQACNVFWQVTSSATVGTNSAFKGTIMALTSIAVQTGTTVEGRALARNGSVTLDNNVFTAPGCDTTSSSSAAGSTAATTQPATATVNNRPSASATPRAVTSPASPARTGTNTTSGTTPGGSTTTPAGSPAHPNRLVSPSLKWPKSRLATTGAPLLGSMLLVGALLIGLGATLLVFGRGRKRYSARH
jgi:hypothetical protein